MYQDLPTEAVRPAEDNLRRRVGDVSDIVASIPTHGIIEPLVVSPQDDGTYLIVAGHRRHAAAVKAGLATVPCIVREMSTEDRVLAALIENGLRNDLRPTEEAGGYFRLVEAGWKIKDLAAATGRSARHVSARLALLELPATVRSKVDQGKVSIADATELLRLKAHPDALKEVAAGVADNEVDDVGWAVRQALGQAERAARRAAAVEALSAAGIAVVEHDGYATPAGVTLLGGHHGLDVDVDDHAGESCHVVVVTRDGDQHPACNAAGGHAKKGGSELMAFADGGDPHLQRAALALAFALAEEHMGPSWGAVGWAQPVAVAHLRFLDDCGYQRSEFEDQRLIEAAETLARRAEERRRWSDRRAAEASTDDGANGDDAGRADDGEDAELLGEPA